MAEGIVTPDGKPLDVDPASADQVERDFARAMSEPAGENDKRPPRRAEKAPEQPKEAPRVRRGRPAKEASQAAPRPVQGLSRQVRVDGVKGIVQLAAGGCLLAERAAPPQQRMALKADAITLASSADQLAEAVADTAAADEKFARLVDKVCAAGPYGALISAVLSVGTQIARNHGANIPGTHSPEDLVAMAEAAS